MSPLDNPLIRFFSMGNGQGSLCITYLNKDPQSALISRNVQYTVFWHRTSFFRPRIIGDLQFITRHYVRVNFIFKCICQRLRLMHTFDDVRAINAITHLACLQIPLHLRRVLIASAIKHGHRRFFINNMYMLAQFFIAFFSTIELHTSISSTLINLKS